jgi:hypothetical protein
VEYGWALKALRYARIVPIMNLAFGEPTAATMPFDMRHLRHPKCTYCLPKGASERRRREELAKLVGSLGDEIGTVLRSEGLRTKAERPPFPAAEPKAGQARFRARGEPLGKAGRFSVTLAEGPAMWLRVMPKFALTAEPWPVTELRNKAPAPNVLSPLGIEAFGVFESGHLFSQDGFGIYVHRSPPNPSPSVAFVFRTGEVWGIDAYHLGFHNVIPFVEPYFIAAFENYTAFLRRQLQVPPPYKWVAGIEGVEGWPIEIPLPARDRLTIAGARGSCMSDTIVKTGTHEDGAAPRVSLRPFFVEAYDMCTVRRPDWMDDFTWPPMRY